MQFPSWLNTIIQQIMNANTTQQSPTPQVQPQQAPQVPQAKQNAPQPVPGAANPVPAQRQMTKTPQGMQLQQGTYQPGGRQPISRPSIAQMRQQALSRSMMQRVTPQGRVQGSNEPNVTSTTPLTNFYGLPTTQGSTTSTSTPVTTSTTTPVTTLDLSSLSSGDQDTATQVGNLLTQMQSIGNSSPFTNTTTASS